MGTIQIDGSTPKLTIGNATAEDALILFDGNAQDFHIGLDDTADDLVIGVGSALGTTTALAIDENAGSTFSGTVTVGVDDTRKDVKFFGATASRYWLWDESADGVVQRGTLTVGVDDTGHDVKFFGATASSYMLWDESADDLNLIASGLGVITAKDLGVGVHIRTADSGGSVDGAADELVIEGSAHNGMTFLTGTTQTSTINFGDSGDNNIGIVEYNHNTNKMHMYTNAALAMTIDSIGAVTKPLQPAFSVNLSSDQDNMSSSTTLTYDTEIFDQNADFNTSNYTFTAPVTGRYCFSVNQLLKNVAADITYIRLKLVTSNRGYQEITTTPAMFDATSDYFPMSGTFLADMDASDTAYVQYIFYEGSGTSVDAKSSADYSHFSGWLVC